MKVKRLSQIPTDWFNNHMDKTYDAIADIILAEFNIITEASNVSIRMKKLGIIKEPIKRTRYRKAYRANETLLRNIDKVHRTGYYKCRNIRRAV